MKIETPNTSDRRALFVFLWAIATASGLAPANILITPKDQSADIIRLTQHTFVFAVRNNGLEKVFVKRLLPSCGCTSAFIDKAELKPGDAAALSICVTAPNVLRPYSVSVAIEFSSDTNAPQELSVSGNVIDPVEVTPNILEFAMVEDQQASPIYVNLKGRMGSTLKVSFVGSNLADTPNAPIPDLTTDVLDAKSGGELLICRYAGRRSGVEIDGRLVINASLNQVPYEIDLPVTIRHLSAISILPAGIEGQLDPRTTIVERRLLIECNVGTGNIQLCGYAPSIATSGISVDCTRAENPRDAYLFIKVEQPLKLVDKPFYIACKLLVDGKPLTVNLPVHLSS